MNRYFMIGLPVPSRRQRRGPGRRRGRPPARADAGSRGRRCARTTSTRPAGQPSQARHASAARSRRLTWLRTTAGPTDSADDKPDPRGGLTRVTGRGVDRRSAGEDQRVRPDRRPPGALRLRSPGAGAADSLRRAWAWLQAERRARPLARRAVRIARPARVRMRSRKPWVFARRRLFGWKVRLLTGHSWTESTCTPKPGRGHNDPTP